MLDCLIVRRLPLGPFFLFHLAEGTLQLKISSMPGSCVWSCEKHAIFSAAVTWKLGIAEKGVGTEGGGEISGKWYWWYLRVLRERSENVCTL